MLLKHRSYVYCGDSEVSWLTFLSTTGHLELLGHCTGANSHSFSCSLKRQEEETWVRTSEHTPVEQSEWGGYHAHTYSLVAILMIIWQPVRGGRRSNTPEENLLNSTIWYPTTQNTVWFEQCVSYPRSWAFPHPFVAVPGRNRTLFRCVFRPRYRIQSAVVQYFR